MSYILSLPDIRTSRLLETVDLIAERLNSQVVVKSRGQSSPLLAISFEQLAPSHMEQLFELMQALGIPFNLRFIEGDSLNAVYVWRLGLREPLKIPAELSASEERAPGLTYSYLLESSYEGVVLAGKELAPPLS